MIQGLFHALGGGREGSSLAFECQEKRHIKNNYFLLLLRVSHSWFWSKAFSTVNPLSSEKTLLVSEMLDCNVAELQKRWLTLRKPETF